MNGWDPDRLRSKVRRLQRERGSRVFRILVFGPGPEHSTYYKRVELENALRGVNGFDVLTVESLGLRTEDELFLMTQEIAIQEEADFVLVLESSEGPLSELSYLASVSGFVRKTYVLHPEEYLGDPRNPSSVPGDILAHYYMSFAYSRDDFAACRVVAKGVAVARAFRAAHLGGDVGANRFD